MTQTYKKAKAEDESFFRDQAGGSSTTVVTKKKKRSLIGEQYYEEFSTEFWKKPGICFSDIRVYFGKSRIFSLKYLLFLGSQHFTMPSTLSTPGPFEIGSDTSSSPHKQTKSSRPVTPSTETPVVSRPVTPTLLSFSQSANIINVTINNNYGRAIDG